MQHTNAKIPRHVNELISNKLVGIANKRKKRDEN